jgi:ribosomal protein S18 acetylase RimI-like enzyme
MVCSVSFAEATISDFTIRPATGADRNALGQLGALLMQTHYTFDPARFLAPGDDAEEGYAWFLDSQLREEDALVLVAERDGRVAGYVYAALEPLSWKELRGPAGFIHDLVVDGTTRGQGLGRALLEAAIEWLKKRGAPRVVLWTAAQNSRAQNIFTAAGFRTTMVEMVVELERTKNEELRTKNWNEERRTENGEQSTRIKNGE